MKRILGLDLGTASIGWAIVNQAETDNEESSIIRIGVRVNPLTTDEKGNFEQGKSITTNAERTLGRSMRRNLQRYRLRRESLIALLKENGFINDDTILSENGNRTTFETYRLRAKAVTEEISLTELARVLLMINKKRGYKSSRKAKNSDEGQLIDGMSIAKTIYDEHLTPGEFTLRLLESGKRYVPSFYRSDLHNELDRIWDVQSQYYPHILTEDFRRGIEGKSRTATSKHFYGAYQITTAQEKDKALRLLTPYRWRVKALTKQLEIEQMAAVICDINGAISDSSGYLGAISDRSKELFFNHQTVGQYLAANIEQNPHFRVKNKVFYRQDYLDEFEAIWENQAKFHPELTSNLKETMRDVVIFYQRKLKSQKGLISLCEFEQRTITVEMGGKEKTKTIGLRVCPKSSPIFQEFRLWQTINNVTLSSVDAYTALTPEQRHLLHSELSISEKLSAAQVLKLLGLNKKKTKEFDLNFQEIKGNTTQAKLYSSFRTIYEMTGHDAGSLDKMATADDKLAVMAQVFEGLGYKTDFLRFTADGDCQAMQADANYRLWHLLYSYVDDNSKTGDEGLIKHIMELTGFEKEYAQVLANITFEPDYGSLSSKAIIKILPFLKQGQIYSDACQSAGYRHSKDSLTAEEIANRTLSGHINILSKNSLRNPVVEKILNQMINVVNELNEQYGKVDEATGVHYFDEVHVELARELKKSAAERKSDYEHINAATREQEALRKEIMETYGFSQVSRNDLIRYRLYLELKETGFKTLYSNTHIQPYQVFSGDFDIEHIIPQAKVFDDSFSNKTLELRDINREKSDMTAYDFVEQKYGKEGLEEYLKRIKFLDKDGSRSKYKKLLSREADIESGFINRDLRDSQYIAKMAKQLLYDITRVVVSTTGSITERLRSDWQLVDALKELNWDKYQRMGMTYEFVNRSGQNVKRIKDWTKRNDHRHHAMDALTIAFTKPSHIQYLNNLNARSDKAGAIYAIEKKELHRDEKDNHLVFNQPFPNMRREALKHLSNILVSIKAKNKVVTTNINITRAKDGNKKKAQLTPRGQLHNETVYGKQKTPVVKLEKVGATFDAAKIATVCSPIYRKALAERLEQFGGDPKKAFTGKNSLAKRPIYIDAEQTKAMPLSVKTKCFEEQFTIRKPITPDLKLDKVIDEGVKRILMKRLDEYGGDAKKAFANLDESPIWLNEVKGISIKSVTIKGVNVATPLHEKKDKDGNPMLDNEGNSIPTDYISTSNNHHVAIFEDADGNYQEHIVSFFEATASASMGLPIVDKNYRNDDGWKFIFTLKQNEYFVFPEYELDENGKPTDVMLFNPNDIDLLAPENSASISKHLYRVQKIATKNYTFRHHLETTVEEEMVLKGQTWIRLSTPNNLKNVVKVRVNKIGQIVAVGEY
ncbi:MAG: type II CRISPR RNA-guided endonuclease Cas9 [Muribaculaceae bacterium]